MCTGRRRARAFVRVIACARERDGLRGTWRTHGRARVGRRKRPLRTLFRPRTMRWRSWSVLVLLLAHEDGDVSPITITITITKTRMGAALRTSEGAERKKPSRRGGGP